MTRLIWLLTAAVVLSACTSSPAPTPSNPTPQPLVLDSFAANPNPSPINLGVQFSWSILGGGNKTCKLDVNNDGTFEYTLNGCDSTSKQSHVYSGVGTFTAKLVVSDGSSTLEKTTVVNVIAENRKPNVVELIAQQTTNPLRVRWVFKVSDAEGDILTCRLDVNNDGEAEFVFTPCTSNAVNSSLPSTAIDSILSLNALNSSTSTNASNQRPANTGGAIEYTYPAKGTYTAKLEVSDAYTTVSSTRSVNVPVSPEVLEFAANPTTLIAKDSTTFAFKVNSPNSLPLKCILTTGDGSTFTFDPCPSNVVLKQNYTYMEAGKYTATLTVQDSLGNITVRNLAFNIAPIRFTQIREGLNHTCALANNQKAYCWGLNVFGQLGNGNNTNANTPQLVGGGHSFTQISVGSSHTCALTPTGQAYCWGYNFYGQLGNGSTGGSANTPQLVLGGHTFSQVSAGTAHTCALTPTNQAYCWGWNFFGHLGNGDNTDYNTPQVVIVASLPPNTTFSQISAGGNHTCALTATNQAYCWGYNGDGQLGTGNNTFANTPQLVSGSHSFSQIISGTFHTCTLTTTGQAYCWGWNNSGQLGNGNNTNANTPQVVLGGHTFSQISGGIWHTCALTTTNQAYCWGSNITGQLGKGDSGDGTDANTPQLVSGGHTFSQVSAGFYHACALTSAGQAYCWGLNNLGQLGNGNNTVYNTPQAVLGSHTFTQIGTGDEHTCAVTPTSQAYCWGRNEFGQLGNGNNTSYNTPQLVSGVLAFSQINTGIWHACALNTANQAYCWGRNSEGQLGNGNNTSYNTPQAVVMP